MRSSNYRKNLIQVNGDLFDITGTGIRPYTVNILSQEIAKHIINREDSIFGTHLGSQVGNGHPVGNRKAFCAFTMKFNTHVVGATGAHHANDPK